MAGETDLALGVEAGVLSWAVGFLEVRGRWSLELGLGMYGLTIGVELLVVVAAGSR